MKRRNLRYLSQGLVSKWDENYCPVDTVQTFPVSTLVQCKAVHVHAFLSPILFLSYKITSEVISEVNMKPYQFLEL